MVIKKYKSERVKSSDLKPGMIVRMEMFGKHSNLPGAKTATEPIFGYVQEWLKNKYASYVAVTWRIAKKWQTENVPIAEDAEWEVLTGTMRNVITQGYLDTARVEFAARVPSAT